MSKRFFYWTIAVAAVFETILALSPGVQKIGFGLGWIGLHSALEGIVAIIGLFIGFRYFSLFKKSGLAKELLLGGGFVVSAAFDVLHILAYGGMFTTVIFPSVNTSELFWLVARFALGISMLGAFFLDFRVGRVRAWLIFMIGLVSLTLLGIYSFALIFGTDIPTLAKVTGPSNLKIINEYIVMALYFALGIIYWRRYRRRGETIYALFAFVAFSIFAEFNLTLYLGPFYMANAVGHILTALAYSALLVQFFSPRRLG